MAVESGITNAEHLQDDQTSREQPVSAPASFSQRRLWLLDRLYGQKVCYNVPLAYRLEGTLDVEALERSLQLVVNRHETLRTWFAAERDDIVQIIASAWPVCLAREDLSRLPSDERLAAARRAAVHQARLPFDLGRLPLLRAALYRLGDHDHVLALSIHHIVFDGWSEGVLLGDLATFYAALVGGQPPALDELPIQYADFASWQRETVTQDAVYEGLRHWWQHLKGAPASLDIPLDHPRPSEPSRRGAQETTVLNADRANALAAVSRAYNATLFMTLLPAFATVLHRYTGQPDVVIGTALAGRSRPELEPLIGFFINTVALRSDFSSDPRFVDLLQAARAASIAAHEYQDVPLEQIVEMLQPERSTAAMPLFQAFLVVQNAGSQMPALPGVRVSRVPVHNGTSKYDLLLDVAEEQGGLVCALEYDTDILERSSAIRLLESFRLVLEQVATAPEARVSQLAMTSERDRKELRRWSVDRTGLTDFVPVHRQVEERARSAPDAVAVDFGGEQLTYQRLDERASRLAGHLAARGIGPGSLVGLCLDRSVDLIVAVVGILKAGCAYVPLDPAYPRERLTSMLEDAQPRGVVTVEGLVDRLPCVDAALVSLDADAAAIDARRPVERQEEVTAKSLAYVMYTSGSTGKPKGVAMPHGPLANLIRWQMARSRPANARTLQFAPISFDVSFQEIFSTLCAGGTLVMIADDDRRDAYHLLHVVRTSRVERLFLPFVALQAFAEATERQATAPPDLRDVITAGEQLQITRSLVGLFRGLSGATLDNQYGPTESHVVTAHRLEGSPEEWPSLPPIGRPIWNAEVHVLDQHRNPVPIGVVGEIYLGGAVLAEGYYGKAALTAERFVQSPFDERARLYQTGDLGRWRPDGVLEYLGRNDRQVKIRGHRVELGDVETALATFPDVIAAAVSTSGSDAANRRLVAHVVSGEVTLNIAELRKHLHARLPEYMVPAVYVQVSALPLTPSGKIDRKALASVEADANAPRVIREATTPAERLLVGIWSELLGQGSVGIDDNFFDLGGHSLLAVRLFSRVHEVFGRSIPFSVLLQRPTIAELALLLEDEPARAPARMSSLVSIRNGSRPPIFFVHGIGGEVWSFVELAKHLDVEQPVFGVQPTEEQRAPLSIATLAERYVEEILSLVPDGPIILGGYCSGVVTAFETARQLRAHGARVDLLVVLDYWFDEPTRSSGLSWSFLKNLPFWLLEDFCATSPRDNLGRLRSKARAWRARLLQRLGGREAAPSVDARDALGMWRFPDHEVERITRYWDLFRTYSFSSYEDPIHVFRARTRALLGPCPAGDMGWRRIASGELSVENVPGSHDTMLRPPFVAALAKRLQRAIDNAVERARARQGAGTLQR
jgi:amino acid adenylation domain-containing protein